ncbi:hypothetical protein LTR86_002000 [Recurvomyces mirabilis]|nr:hypothetical protein LTR86_002000 [Recurvomyces mirabilis]
MDNAAVANVFGTLGAVCWSIQLIPQIVLNYRRHSARGLSAPFMMYRAAPLPFWAFAGLPLGVYNIVSDLNIALQVQPQILTLLSLATWIQCYYYERKWSISKALSVVTPVACIMGGIEVGLIFAVRAGLRHGIRWPATLMAALAAALLALGVLEQYIAIWKNCNVEGISFLFCAIDALGDVTSIIAVVFERKLKVVGLVAYSVEFVLWCGIFACGGYYKLLPLIKRRTEHSRSYRDTLPTNQITLQDLPSSTSVFHTPSSLRDRSRVAPSTSE